ncbi:phage integrase SAM-like domain-containing protein [Aquimarina celericrescens]|nr:phage integrase SAM-like domain-containing protein [Aquimarina celericrescens]
MATIRIIGTHTKDKISLYIRVRNGRKADVSYKTPYKIDKKSWSDKKQTIKATSTPLKKIKNKLDSLVIRIQERMDEDAHKGIDINSRWVKKVVDGFFNNDNNGLSPYIIDWINHIIDNHKTIRTVQGNIGISANRLKAYKTLKNLVNDFQGRSMCKVLEVDQLFYDDFCTWLISKKYSDSTLKKYADDLIAVCKFAKRQKVVSNPELYEITKYAIKRKEPLTLTDTELQKIKEVNLPNNHLENTRKWILLGCTLAQRVEDLLNIDETNFKHVPDENGNLVEVIHIIQSKTGAEAIFLAEQVKEIIKDGLPYKISSQKLRDYVKKVCELAEINSPTHGEIIKIIKVGNKEVKRKVKGTYPKWMLITPHVFRKTGASYYNYKYGTTVAKIHTGHIKDETLKIYVNDNLSKKVTVLLEAHKEQGLKEKSVSNKTILKVIKNASGK